jgi:hypothetical protein
MPQYLPCNYLPDDFDPSTVTKAMIEEIHALEFNRFRPVAKTVGRVLVCLESGLASTGSDTFGITVATWSAITRPSHEFDL